MDFLLLCQMEYQLITLTNGLRIIFKLADLPVAHACVIINAGSRDEPEGKAGLAHFIEHLIFKKTSRRSTTQILNCLELVGADLNAYTTKEYTCLHASFLNEHLSRTLDLFEDILFHSEFPENELEKEKGIILDEISSYKDSPEEAIGDDFEDIIFKNHPLGHNILGTAESLTSLTKSDIQAFIKENYFPENMVIGITANKSLGKVRSICEKYFGHLTSSNSTRKRLASVKNKAIKTITKKPISQVHYMLGAAAYDIHHPLKTALLLTNNILGGMGMSSRLNLEIREKYGIAYTIESNYSPLSDTGILSIYFGTDIDKVEKAESLLFKELKKLRDKKLGPIQLQQAKRKYIGQIALGEENRIALIKSLAKSEMDHGHAESLEQIFTKINAVSPEQIQEVSNEVLYSEGLTSLIFYPEEH
jgi:predicted Zn-dependent peptidase